LIDDICAQPKGSMQLAYFYCRLNDEHHHSAGSIFSTLLKQLCSSHSSQSFPRGVLETYRTRQHQGFTADRLTVVESISLLLEAAPSNGMTFIAVDGLDECSMEERREVVRGFRRILQSKNLVFKIAVSSRDDDDLVRAFREDAVIAMDKDVNFEDLTRFIEDEVEESQLLRGEISDELKKDVVNTLIQGADGM
jgi:hypothetical protein